MATESFFEDMVIDTPEAAANLTELLESGVRWKRGDTVIKWHGPDSDLIRRLAEKYCSDKNDLGHDDRIFSTSIEY